MLQDIHSAVIGNERLGHKGLVKRVAHVEGWQRRVDLKLAAVLGGATVIMILIQWIFKR